MDCSGRSRRRASAPTGSRAPGRHPARGVRGRRSGSALQELADKGVRPTGAAPGPAPGTRSSPSSSPSGSAASSSSSSSRGDVLGRMSPPKACSPASGSARLTQRVDRELAERWSRRSVVRCEGRDPRQQRNRRSARGWTSRWNWRTCRRERSPVRDVRTHARVARADRGLDPGAGDRRRRAAGDRSRPLGRRPDGAEPKLAGPGQVPPSGRGGSAALVGRGRGDGSLSVDAAGVG